MNSGHKQIPCSSHRHHWEVLLLCTTGIPERMERFPLVGRGGLTGRPLLVLGVPAECRVQTSALPSGTQG